MGITFTKGSVDVGIVVRDVEAALAFYRDALGLEPDGDTELPGLHMWRLRCGTSVIKLVQPARMPEASNPPGGIGGATGLRYLTFFVGDVSAGEATMRERGYQVVVPRTEIRPGVSICMVEDPDGNWVELVEGQ